MPSSGFWSFLGSHLRQVFPPNRYHLASSAALLKSYSTPVRCPITLPRISIKFFPEDWPGPRRPPGTFERALALLSQLNDPEFRNSNVTPGSVASEPAGLVCLDEN